MLYFIVLVFFLVLSLINIIFLYNKEKYKKISVILSTIIVTIAIIFIVILNVDYNYKIQRASKYLTDKEFTFCKNTLIDMNLTFISGSVLLCLFLFGISFIKMKYKIFYYISLALIFIAYFVLLFLKIYHINKFNIDFIGLALDLRSYYLSICILPLLLKKYRI